MPPKKESCRLPSGGPRKSPFCLVLFYCFLTGHSLVLIDFNCFQVISKKDQAQYWWRYELPYSYVSVDQFCQMFKESHLGKKLDEELSKPYDKSQSDKNALSFSIYSLSKWELFKACMAREWLLMKRNTFVYVFKTAQVRSCSNERFI